MENSPLLKGTTPHRSRFKKQKSSRLDELRLLEGAERLCENPGYKDKCMAEKGERRIALGADHAGYQVKERIKRSLQEKGFEVIDYGTHADEAVDYPDYAKRVAQSVAQAESARGILVCGTGLGMAMTANKFRGIRAATCNDTYTARMAGEHTNANVLCVGARVVDADHAIAIVKEWLKAKFGGERHQRRIDKITEIERDQASLHTA